MPHDLQHIGHTAGNTQVTLPDYGHLPCAQGTRRRPQNTRHICLPCVVHGESSTATNHDGKPGFAVCLPCVWIGTWQTKAHDGGDSHGTVTARGDGAGFEVRLVLWILTHGKDLNFAVCQVSWHKAKIKKKDFATAAARPTRLAARTAGRRAPHAPARRPSQVQAAAGRRSPHAPTTTK